MVSQCHGAGLIDASVTVNGYRESATDPPGTAQVAIAQLWSDFGVVAVRDTGSGWAPLLRQQQACAGQTQIVGGGLVLVEQDPIDDCDVNVTADSIDAVIALALAGGQGWLNMRPHTEAWLDHCAGRAADAGLRLAIRGPLAAEAAARVGASVLDSFSWLALAGSAGPARPAALLAAWAEADMTAIRDRVLRLRDADVAVTSELLALYRAVFVKQGLDAGHLDRLEPILPHTKHLADMRRAGGFVSGRRAMAKHSGAVQPKAAQLRVAETGWQRLLEAVAGAVSDGLVLLPGSRSPQMTLCPGYGLLEELSVIAHAGVSTERTLELATVQAAFTLAVELPSAGEAAVSAPSEPKGFLSLRPSFSNI